MKKNLLTLIMMLAFVCGGVLVNEVKAATQSNKKSVSNSKKISQSKVQNIESRYKKSISKLKQLCSTNKVDDKGPCAVAINGATELYDRMISKCNMDLNGQACQDAQTACENQVWWVLFICALFPGGVSNV